MNTNTITPKAKATVLQEFLGTKGFVLNRGHALEAVAKMEGLANYRTLVGTLGKVAEAAEPDETVHNLPYGIVIRCAGEGGSLDSELKQELTYENDDPESAKVAVATAHAIESLLLALACNGVNLSAPEFARGLKAAVETLACEIE